MVTVVSEVMRWFCVSWVFLVLPTGTHGYEHISPPALKFPPFLDML